MKTINIYDMKAECVGALFRTYNVNADPDLVDEFKNEFEQKYKKEKPLTYNELYGAIITHGECYFDFKCLKRCM